MTASLEPEIHDIGARLAAAFPSTSRHPLKALDAKAMDLAARDDELRAALFRFVDVMPACRSLDARSNGGTEAAPPPTGGAPAGDQAGYTPTP